jgi:eukaryotic-like serine/threonine-protein kinase
MAYEKVQELGRGGFGEVWKVRRDSDRQEFAMKTLIHGDNESKARFSREVRLLLGMQHPRIIRIVDHNLEADPLWFVMPLYQGSLRDHCLQLSTQPERIGRIFECMMEAMEYAHAHRVIHRDLKPENVLMNTDEDLAVADFGLARRVDATTSRKTTSQQGFGTLGYMAPEQYMDVYHADERADVYALGVILRELCTGSIHSWLARQQAPAGLQIIISRCTQTRHEDRYESAAALRLAFRTMQARTADLQAVQRIRDLDQNLLRTLHIDRIANLIASAARERRLLHDLAVKFPEDRLRELSASSPEAFNLLASEFAAESVQPEQWWSFEYVDVICAAAQKLHRCTRDVELRARMIGTILQTGVDYNRYASMQSAADMIEAVQDDREALALLNVLQSLSGSLSAIADRVHTDRLNQCSTLFLSRSAQPRLRNRGPTRSLFVPRTAYVRR